MKKRKEVGCGGFDAYLSLLHYVYITSTNLDYLSEWELGFREFRNVTELNALDRWERGRWTFGIYIVRLNCDVMFWMSLIFCGHFVDPFWVRKKGLARFKFMHLGCWICCLFIYVVVLCSHFSPSLFLLLPFLTILV